MLTELNFTDFGFFNGKNFARVQHLKKACEVKAQKFEVNRNNSKQKIHENQPRKKTTAERRAH